MSPPGLETTIVIEPAESDDLDQALVVFLGERARLFGIARRVTGDPSTAEDVVQDAWLRWQRTDRREIRNPAAFLTTTTTHLAINVIQSARHRHETPTDSLSVEIGDPGQDPTTRAEHAAAVEETLRTLMAQLSPGELAAYILRKAFDYPHDEIARLLRTTTANARQLVRRGQQRTGGDRRWPVDADLHRRLTHAFLIGADSGDLRPLTRVLADHASVTIQRHRRRPVRAAHAAARRDGAAPSGEATSASGPAGTLA